ncbi:MAG: carotenoid oxygenase family protein, partial [Chloroflexota bacterium]
MSAASAGDSIRWFDAPACYVFHTTNAYEDGDDVVLTGCRMNSTNVLEAAEMPTNRNGDVYGGSGDRARLHRGRFNLATGTVYEEQLDDVPSDFPRVNESLLGRSHRYSYSARFAEREDVPLFNGLLKYDHATGQALSFSHGPNRFGGEGVLGVGDERASVKAGHATEAGDDRGVEPAGADGGVAEVDHGV